jgi:hypothetical protein
MMGGIDTDATADLERVVSDDYARLVRAVALACGSVPAAEDAVQQALARAWDRVQRGEQIDRLGGWIVTMAPSDGDWSSMAVPAPRLGTTFQGEPIWTGEELLFWADGRAFRPSDQTWREIARPEASPDLLPRARTAWAGDRAYLVALATNAVPEHGRRFEYDVTPPPSRWLESGSYASHFRASKGVVGRAT